MVFCTEALTSFTSHLEVWQPKCASTSKTNPEREENCVSSFPTAKYSGRIAEAVTEDPEAFMGVSVAELAEPSRVSTGSGAQFCKPFELSGLQALKLGLARELAEPLLPCPVPGNGDNHGSAFHKVFSEHLRSLRETLRFNSPKTLDSTARAICQGRRIVLFSIGLSYPVAHSLYARLRFIGLPAFIEFDSHLQLVAASELARGDVAVAVSVTVAATETVECLRLAKACGARTICITNSADSPLAREADFRLYGAPSEVRYSQAPLASRVILLALVDALVVVVGLRRKRKGLSILQRAKDRLRKRRMVRP